MEEASECWRIESKKYDGHTHRTWMCAYPLQLRQVYEDEYTPNLMLRIPALTKVVEANGENWSSSYDVIACFYEKKHYQVMVLRKHRTNEFYCNSCSVAQISIQDRKVQFIDLDLDLLVDKTRNVRIVDRREFEENAVLYNYPQELKTHVEEDLDDLIRQVHMQRGVFSNQFMFP